MVTTQPTINQQQISKRTTLDTSKVTVAAFNAIDKLQKTNKDVFEKTLAQTKYIQTHKENWVYPYANHSPIHKTKVKVVTNQDQQEHTYFHSLSLDAQVTDFLHTCELRCPYDSDLMEYWEPIRQSCVVYGTNQGDYKPMFVGRVRELIQDGYELSITLQNYGWKFKQDVSQSYANDNVINKNGLQIMYLMFEALKIEAWVISESAKLRLKQVGIDSDGNLVANGEEIEEMPDLLERLKESNPSKLIKEDYTLYNKLVEREVHNIENINYTLKYEEKTPVMKEIESNGANGGFSAGKNIYNQTWGSANSSSSSNSAGLTSAAQSTKGCNAPSRVCSIVQNNGMNSALQQVFLFNRDCTNNLPKDSIVNYANQYPSFYNSQVKVCLQTISKHCSRKDKRNGANEILNSANFTSTMSNVRQTATNVVNKGVNIVKNVVNKGVQTVKAIGGAISSGIKQVASFFGF